MMILEYPIAILFLIGLLCLILPARFRALIQAVALPGSLYALGAGIYGFLFPPASSLTGFLAYRPFSAAVALGCAFFCFIVVCYSLRYARSVEKLNLYYAYIFWSTAFSLGTVYSTNLVILLIFWGLAGLMLYLLAGLAPGAANAAKKSFVFIGGSDSLMVLGIALLWAITGSFDLYSIRIPLASAPLPAAAAFLLLVIAALTKAGAVPFHTWIPDFAEKSPLSLTAFLPASLDKLLGIFLLVLITNQLFVLNTAMSFLLLLIGAVTVISAVYMAMIQHDMRRLLSYHAVSQVGYMVLGIATGSALGIAGGVFHMFNHAIYKSALFLSAGAVEDRTGTTNLDRLGGLSRYLPVTFIVCLIASLSISGVPPFNGFASKWMIYQSLLYSYTGAAPALIKYSALVFLIVALFGSALTLASFMKLIHSVFLGQPAEKPGEGAAKYKEVSFTMLLPMTILAALCVLFGVFPAAIALKGFVLPALSTFNLQLPGIPGLWLSGTATVFIVAGLLLGVILYFVSGLKPRTDRPFTGGEEVPLEARAAGTEFYKTVSDIGFFKTMYALAEKKFFDLYDLLTGAALGCGGFLSRAHTGSLQTYLLFFILGFTVILIISAL